MDNIGEIDSKDETNDRAKQKSSKVSFVLDEGNNDDVFVEEELQQQQSVEEPVPVPPPDLYVKASVRLFNRIIASVGKNSVENMENNLYSPHKNESISYRYSRRRFDLKELKRWTYMMLEKPTGRLALLHRLFTFSIILLTILFSAFTTMDPISDWAEHSLFFIELFVTVYFFIEYLLRVWSCDTRLVNKGWRGKMKCMTRPIMVIELLAFIFGVVLIIGSSHTLNFSGGDSSNVDKNGEQIGYFGTVPLTILRFLQLVRLLYVDRKAHTWIILLDVCYKHKFELITSVYIGFVTLLLSSYLIYHCERSSNDAFHTYSDAVYWAIITMTTIGYGDISPKTFYGKIIATGLCVLGVAFWTLPGGIIGSGFAFKIEQRNKIKKFNRLVPAAAHLIKAWWRMRVILDIPTENTAHLIAILKGFDVSLANESKSGSSDKIKLRENVINEWFQNIDVRQVDENLEERKLFMQEARRKEQELQNLNFIYRKLRPETILEIRTILFLRFFVAKNKFKLAHKPYDFKDVIEQYTKGNMNILIKIKEMQRKLDQVSNVSARGTLIRSSFQPSPASTLRAQRSFSRQMSFETPLPRDHTYLALETRVESIEQKLDQLISICSGSSTQHRRRKNSNNRREDDIDE